MGRGPEKKERKQRNQRKPRPSTRELVRWSTDLDVLALLTLQKACNIRKIALPWDDVARMLGPKFTAGACVQHLAKLRKLRVKQGLRVPEGLKRGGGPSNGENPGIKALIEESGIQRGSDTEEQETYNFDEGSDFEDNYGISLSKPVKRRKIAGEDDNDVDIAQVVEHSTRGKSKKIVKGKDRKGKQGEISPSVDGKDDDKGLSIVTSAKIGREIKKENSPSSFGVRQRRSTARNFNKRSIQHSSAGSGEDYGEGKFPKTYVAAGADFLKLAKINDGFEDESIFSQEDRTDGLTENEYDEVDDGGEDSCERLIYGGNMGRDNSQEQESVTEEAGYSVENGEGAQFNRKITVLHLGHSEAAFKLLTSTDNCSPSSAESGNMSGSSAHASSRKLDSFRRAGPGESFPNIIDPIGFGNPSANMYGTAIHSGLSTLPMTDYPASGTLNNPFGSGYRTAAGRGYPALQDVGGYYGSSHHYQVAHNGFEDQLHDQHRLNDQFQHNHLSQHELNSNGIQLESPQTLSWGQLLASDADPSQVPLGYQAAYREYRETINECHAPTNDSSRSLEATVNDNFHLGETFRHQDQDEYSDHYASTSDSNQGFLGIPFDGCCDSKKDSEGNERSFTENLNKMQVNSEQAKRIEVVNPAGWQSDDVGIEKRVMPFMNSNAFGKADLSTNDRKFPSQSAAHHSSSSCQSSGSGIEPHGK